MWIIVLALNSQPSVPPATTSQSCQTSPSTASSELGYLLALNKIHLSLHLTLAQVLPMSLLARFAHSLFSISKVKFLITSNASLMTLCVARIKFP
ncbi:uncharacterized protein K444DRAFT_65200 [Hyaloscypha bicolor E]|uniref:Uncharacterized protein n=1 Tax=Hyaloscypha bicolor E TaxID=1095630 RepID=A0A2J6T0C4_9HELO|nr:uncharacterized protein K444DRAFT_65200 [Hyaloscypha bicolor E]PMD56475.1 hypothetical protein K444DRAFT_65200 [Hyaloscypha bicolor E]